MTTIVHSEAHIDRLKEDRGWRGVLTVFLSERYCEDARVWRHIDLEAERIDWRAMLGEHFSSGEDLIVRAACSLYTGYCLVPDDRDKEHNVAEVNLWHLVGLLDDEHLTILLRAIAVAGKHPVQWTDELR